MSTLVLNKNFGHLLVSDDFLSDTVKTLHLRIESKKGHIIKKEVRENDKVTIEDIKSVESATFGKDSVKIDVLDKIKHIIDTENKMEQLKKLNKLFVSFCKAFLKVLCPRCYIKQTNSTGFNPHNTGKINLLFLNCQISYYNELFDGMIRCFIAYLINEDQSLIPEKKGRWIETFAHIITNIRENAEGTKKQIHFDYSKIIHIYFTGESTYKTEYKKLECKMKETTASYIKIFYDYMYPALKYFNDNKKDIFIRHGLEKNCESYSKTMIYPPNDNDSGWRIHKVTKANNSNVATKLPAYPIEFDKLPLTACSNHSQKEIYGNVKGFIARTPFLKNGGSIHIRYDKDDSIMAREHLFAESSIHIRNWVFTFRQNYNDKVKKEVKMSLRAIIKEGLPIVAQEALTSFANILELLTNKFIMLH